MECVTIAPLMRAGRLIPVGTTIDLPLAKYEQLRASGHVRVPAEHTAIVSAEQEAAAFIAEAARTAEAARATALEAAAADAEAEAELAREAAQAEPDAPTGDHSARRKRQR